MKIDNCTFINAVLYIAENGCKWRVLPKEYGKWNSVYKRFAGWAEKEIMQKIFKAIRKERLADIRAEVIALDSTSCKVRPDGHGALKKLESK